MYTSFRVKNFRGFEDLEMSDLKRINLIAGKNNTGKTSLLEAVGIHAGRYDTILSRMNFSPLQTSIPDSYIAMIGVHSWATLFNSFNTKALIRISASGNFPTEHEEVKISLMAQEELEDTNIIRIANRIKLQNPDNATLFPDAVRVWRGTASGARFAQIGGQLIVDNFLSTGLFAAISLATSPIANSNDDTEYFSKLKRSKQTKMLVNALNIIEPRLIDLDLLNNGLNANIEGLSELIPLSSMGEGMVRLTSIVLAISAAKDGVVLIDEIENGLHYSVQVDVWKALLYAAQQFNVQIFATTHSYEMIRAAYEAFADQPNEFRYHRLDRHLKTGKIIATTYDAETLEAAVETRFEVR